MGRTVELKQEKITDGYYIGFLFFRHLYVSTHFNGNITFYKWFNYF